jgi:hypothetical protein
MKVLLSLLLVLTCLSFSGNDNETKETLKFDLKVDTFNTFSDCSMWISNQSNMYSAIYFSKFFDNQGLYPVLIPVSEDSFSETYELNTTFDDFFICGLLDTYKPIFIRPQSDTVISFYIRQRQPSVNIVINYADSLSEEDLAHIDSSRFWHYDFKIKTQMISFTPVKE